MVWVIPVKRTSLSKLTRFSKFKDIDVDASPYFLLQERKKHLTLDFKDGQKKTKTRPNYRIITKGMYPYYEIAYGNDVEELRAKEWAYIVKQLPEQIPPHLDPKARSKWLLAHFTQVALENDGGTGDALDEKDISDDDEEIQPTALFTQPEKTNTLTSSITPTTATAAGTGTSTGTGTNSSSNTVSASNAPLNAPSSPRPVSPGNPKAALSNPNAPLSSSSSSSSIVVANGAPTPPSSPSPLLQSTIPKDAPALNIGPPNLHAHPLSDDGDSDLSDNEQYMRGGRGDGREHQTSQQSIRLSMDQPLPLAISSGATSPNSMIRHHDVLNSMSHPSSPPIVPPRPRTWTFKQGDSQHSHDYTSSQSPQASSLLPSSSTSHHLHDDESADEKSEREVPPSSQSIQDKRARTSSGDVNGPVSAVSSPVSVNSISLPSAPPLHPHSHGHVRSSSSTTGSSSFSSSGHPLVSSNIPPSVPAPSSPYSRNRSQSHQTPPSIIPQQPDRDRSSGIAVSSIPRASSDQSGALKMNVTKADGSNAPPNLEPPSSGTREDAYYDATSDSDGTGSTYMDRNLDERSSSSSTFNRRRKSRYNDEVLTDSDREDLLRRARSPTSQRRSSSSQSATYSPYYLPPSTYLSSSHTPVDPISLGFPMVKRSDFITLRGRQCWIACAIAMNVLFVLLRDASISSFGLYILLVNLALYAVIERGNPCTLSILLELVRPSSSSSSSSFDASFVPVRPPLSSFPFQTEPPARAYPYHQNHHQPQIASSVPTPAPASAAAASVSPQTRSPNFTPSSPRHQPSESRQQQLLSYSPSSSQPQQSELPNKTPSPLLETISHQVPTSASTALSESLPNLSLLGSQSTFSSIPEGAEFSSPVPEPLSSPTDVNVLPPHSESAPPTVSLVPSPSPSLVPSSSPTPSPIAPLSVSASPSSSIAPGTRLPISVTVSSHPSQAVPGTTSWCDIDAKTFVVREQGYKLTKKKSQSLNPSYYDIIGMDLFTSDTKIKNIHEHIAIPEVHYTHSSSASSPSSSSSSASSALGGSVPSNEFYDPETGVPDHLVIHFQVPSYPPSNPLWGKAAIEDGPGWSLVLYYKLSASGREEIKNETTNAAKLWKLFVSDVYNPETAHRLKCIPRVNNIPELNLSWTLSGMMKKANNKPFLTQPQHEFRKGPGWLCVDVDVHRFSYPARLGANNFISFVTRLVVHLGFVVEGREDDELPEQILTASEVAFMQVDSAQSLEWWKKKFASEGKLV